MTYKPDNFNTLETIIAAVTVILCIPLIPVLLLADLVGERMKKKVIHAFVPAMGPFKEKQILCGTSSGYGSFDYKNITCKKCQGKLEDK